MDLFSISQLEQFSGIKSHTIRVWERRYNALNPTRSEGNTRYYNNAQLRRLLNIVSLMDSDYKVSELCAMPDEKLAKLIEKLQEKSTTNEASNYFISQLIAAGMKYDEPYFDKIFSHCLLRYGLKNAYVEIIYPMLVRIGLMWASDTIPPAHEHFISNMLRQKIFTAIDSLPPANSPDTWLLFLPEDEFHEIGLLFAQYLIRLSGRKAIYLGGNVPLQSLSSAVKSTDPDNLLLFLVHHNLPETVQEYLDMLSKNFSKKKIHVAGNSRLIAQLTSPQNTHWLQSAEDLIQQIP